MSDKQNTERCEQVTVFLPPGMKDMLVQAAKANYRTLSGEAGFRIAQTFCVPRAGIATSEEELAATVARQKEAL